MLVITRRLGETIHLPDLGVEFSIKRIRGNRVVVGIAAPREIRVLRGEILNPPAEEVEVEAVLTRAEGEIIDI